MSAVFFITLFLLAAIAYTIYRQQQRQASVYDYELRAAHPRSLFSAGDADEEAAATGILAAPAAERRATLLRRAAEGDCTALADAPLADDAKLYRATLDELVKWSKSSPDKLQALAEVVATGENLRGSVELSQTFSRLWEQSPDTISTARMLHLAALSDDAAEFARVVELAVRYRREDRLSAISAEDLRALVESEFWVLSQAARASGAAFVLKQQLAALRQEP
ncbi:MAG: hypothetical protein QOF61_238 [Acidobacteriota bacterium]|nr:hypothetical protein [Acidobacteriota bacterium]